MKVTRLQRELCADLARKVDVTHSVLVVNGCEIPLTYVSVTKVMGLPCSGHPIPFHRHSTKAEFETTTSRFNLNTSDRVSQYELWACLNGSHEGMVFDDEFEGKYLLFTIATLLKPTTSVYIHFRDYIPVLNGMHTLCEAN